MEQIGGRSCCVACGEERGINEDTSGVEASEWWVGGTRGFHNGTAGRSVVEGPAGALRTLVI